MNPTSVVCYAHHTNVEERVSYWLLRSLLYTTVLKVLYSFLITWKLVDQSDDRNIRIYKILTYTGRSVFIKNNPSCIIFFVNLDFTKIIL